MRAFFKTAVCAATLVAAMSLTPAPPASAQSSPPPSPGSLNVTYVYSAGKYRFTAVWSASPGATLYHLTGHGYNGSGTTVSWTVPDNFEDLSIEYNVTACNAAGCSAPAGPAYAQ